MQTVARLLGADRRVKSRPIQGSLRRRLETISPEAHGLSRGRWMNVRSLLGKALALVRPMLPGRSVHPLMPEWAALAATLPRGRRDHILALLRYLSARGIGPGEVTLTDLEAYRQAILHDRLRSKPEQTWDSLVWSWNACRREIAGWPAIEIERESRRKTYILPWSAFPASLRQEIDQFLLRQSGKDLSEDGPPRPLRATSLKTREYQLRVAASILVHLGDAPDSIQSIAALLTVENYKRILGVLLQRAGGTKSPQVAHMATFLKGVARHWLKVDDATLHRMGKIATKVSISWRGMTAKNRERLRPFNDDSAVERFQAVPSRIRASVERSKLPPRRRALLAQRAAAIAILLVAPIRMKNLINLDVERHLILRGGLLYLVVPEHEVKNEHLIDFELPNDTAELVAWYVREHRPHLLTGQSTALFPGDRGVPKSAATLAAQICAAVFQHTGLKVNVHLFRHIAAKTYLDRQPGDYFTIQRMLGHKSSTTTQSAYTGMETRAAGRHFVNVIRQRSTTNAASSAPRVNRR